MKTPIHFVVLTVLCGGLVSISHAQDRGGAASATETADPTAKLGPDGRSAYLRWQKARRDADLAYLVALRAAVEKATRQNQLDQAVARARPR